MDRRNLLKQELNSFIDGVKKNIPVSKVIVFGSYATGNVKEDSDLDIVLIAETKDNFWKRLKAISKHYSNKVGMDVLFYTPQEFNDLADKRVFFKKEIVEKGLVVYG